jgi:tetratricopeptide (TPR) repeat protein
MDCRRTTCVTAALLCAVVGCVTPNGPNGAGVKSDSTISEAAKAAAEPREVVKQLNPDTLVSYGALQEQIAAEMNLTPQEKERYLEDARQAYQRAIDTDPKFIPAYMAMGRLFESTERHDRAMVFFEKALKVNGKDPQLWAEVGMVYARNKQWEPALRVLKKAVELDPDRKAIVRNYGMCLARAGHYDESLVVLRGCMGEAEGQCVVARMLHHMGQNDASLQHVQAALRVDPNLAVAQELLTELQGGGTRGETAGGPITEPQPVTLTGGQ